MVFFIAKTGRTEPTPHNGENLEAHGAHPGISMTLLEKQDHGEIK
jgi:hypothetical protein